MRIFFSVVLVSLSVLYVKAQDVVVMRNGVEYEGKILQASQNEITIEDTSRNGLFGKVSTQKTLQMSDVYMLKYKDRGNFYIKADGNRISGEKQKIDRTADIVYLIEGKEIPAWDLEFGADNISFQATKSKKRALSNNITISKSAIFMIKYSDGSKDIINDLSIKEESQENTENETNTKADEQKPQYKVVFHNVKKGDTIESVANQYNVSEDDLKSWNDLNTGLSSKSKLKIGSQLIIQQAI